jgi:predicted RNase H-like nuclease (RuvC/YqgF family)
MKNFKQPKEAAGSDGSAPLRKVSAKTKRVSQSRSQIEKELRQLRAQVASLTQELETCRAELTAADLAASVLRRHESLDKPYTLVEPQNDNLMNLFVAAARLHAHLDRSGVLAAIREILSDLIGSQAMAIFEIDATGDALLLVESIGVEANSMRRIALGSGLIGTAAKTGVAYFSDDAESEVVACVPLKIGASVTGAIAVIRLFEQKQQLEMSDRELLEFMSTHAALALYRTAPLAQRRQSAGAPA